MDRIVAFHAKRPFVLAYLALEYADEQGERRHLAIVCEAASGKKDLDELETVLKMAT